MMLRCTALTLRLAARANCWTLLGLLTFATAGCANQQNITNPFTTADRVPPPQTRIPTAATGQPYYQGGVAPTIPAAPVSPAGVPAATVPQSTFAPGAFPQSSAPPAVPTPAIVASNEQAIGVPTDDSALRLASTPPPAPPSPMVQQQQFAAAPTSAAPVASATPAGQQAVVVQAAANQPALARPMRVTLTPANQQFAAVTQPSQTHFSPVGAAGDGLPWVSGSAPRAASPLTVAPQPVQPAAYLAAAPRVRLPGYPAPQQTFVMPATTNQPIGRVQITELPRTPITPPAAVPAATSPDGFRPRQSAGPTF
ncbi:MAG: hypothetical protein AAGF31_07370 [Planctomycetota bacterium]